MLLSDISIFKWKNFLIAVLFVFVLILCHQIVRRKLILKELNEELTRLVQRENVSQKADKADGVKNYYQVKIGNDISTGKSFEEKIINHPIFDALEPRITATLAQSNIGNFPIVTGSSANHYAESLTGLHSILSSHIKHTIYFYDLGLTEKQRIELKSANIVRYRMFDFDKYPEHVRTLDFYAFKILIWAEMLVEFDNVLWVDASGRFQSCFSDVAIENLAVIRRSGVAVFSSTGHSIVAATHPAMYKYFPLLNVQKAMTANMMEANFVMFSINKSFYDNVFRWMTLCALEKKCIVPEDASKTCKQTTSRTYWGGTCHRFDQSVLNILLTNHYQYDIKPYVHKLRKCMSIDRTAGKNIVDTFKNNYISKQNKSSNKPIGPV